MSNNKSTDNKDQLINDLVIEKDKLIQELQLI